jgi:Lon protease-like protein
MGIPTRPNKQGWVHPLLREVAIGFAQTLYERLALDNQWYALNKDRKRWVAARWPDMLPAVRTHLARLLGMNTLPDSEKMKIHDALVKDNELRLGRARAQEARIAKAQRHVH